MKLVVPERPFADLLFDGLLFEEGFEFFLFPTLDFHLVVNLLHHLDRFIEKQTLRLFRENVDAGPGCLDQLSIVQTRRDGEHLKADAQRALG